MIGAILINGYFENSSVQNQVSRLREEFTNLGVETDVLKSNEVLSTIPENEFYEYKNGIKIPLKKYDFIIYLNKDRYQAECLENAGYRLFNSAKSIVLCDDKMLTDIALKKEVKVPDTVSSPIMYSEKDDENFLSYVVETLGFPVIVKNVYGSMGREVYKADNALELNALFNKLRAFPHIYQRAIVPLGEDVRITVVGGKAVSAMKRKSQSDFRSNAALGGVCEKAELTENKRKIAERAARILGLDYAGVDVISDGKEDYICEVNSNAFFYKTEEVTGVNVAKLYAEHVILKVKNGRD